VEEGTPDRQLNIHIDPENKAGVYANFANISFSPFEFSLTFARVDHEVEEGDVPGVVVARVNVSHKFMRDLLDAMQDSYSKWSTTEGIRNLPEAPPRSEES
jgi:hemerythrin-like domain-containing protein